MATRTRQYAIVKKNPGRVCKKDVGTVRSATDCDPGCDFANASANGKRPAVCRLPKGSASQRVTTAGRTPEAVEATIMALHESSGLSVPEFKRQVKYVLETSTRTPGSPKAKINRRSKGIPWPLSAAGQAASLSSNIAQFSGAETKAGQALAAGLSSASGASVVSYAKLNALVAAVNSGVSSTKATAALRASQRSGSSASVDALLESAATQKIDAISQSGAGGAAFADAATRSGASPEDVLILASAVEERKIPIEEAAQELVTVGEEKRGGKGKGSEETGGEGGALTVYEAPAASESSSSSSSSSTPARGRKRPTPSDSTRVTRLRASQGARAGAGAGAVEENALSLIPSSYDWEY